MAEKNAPIIPDYVRSILERVHNTTNEATIVNQCIYEYLSILKRGDRDRYQDYAGWCDVSDLCRYYESNYPVEFIHAKKQKTLYRELDQILPELKRIYAKSGKSAVMLHCRNFLKYRKSINPDIESMTNRYITHGIRTWCKKNHVFEIENSGNFEKNDLIFSKNEVVE